MGVLEQFSALLRYVRRSAHLCDNATGVFLVVIYLLLFRLFSFCSINFAMSKVGLCRCLIFLIFEHKSVLSTASVASSPVVVLSSVFFAILRIPMKIQYFSCIIAGSPSSIEIKFKVPWSLMGNGEESRVNHRASWKPLWHKMKSRRIIKEKRPSVSLWQNETAATFASIDSLENEPENW